MPMMFLAPPQPEEPITKVIFGSDTYAFPASERLMVQDLIKGLLCGAGKPPRRECTTM